MLLEYISTNSQFWYVYIIPFSFALMIFVVWKVTRQQQNCKTDISVFTLNQYPYVVLSLCGILLTSYILILIGYAITKPEVLARSNPMDKYIHWLTFILNMPIFFIPDYLWRRFIFSREGICVGGKFWEWKAVKSIEISKAKKQWAYEIDLTLIERTEIVKSYCVKEKRKSELNKLIQEYEHYQGS
jgi:hypothetical protein